MAVDLFKIHACPIPEISVSEDSTTESYVLRREDALMVKQLAPDPTARRVAIRSDNPAYPSWEGCDLASTNIGRVVGCGREAGVRG